MMWADKIGLESFVMTSCDIISVHPENFYQCLFVVFVATLSSRII